MKPSDEQLLEALRDAARSREADIDPRWTALLEGKLSPEQQAELAKDDRSGEKIALFTAIDEAARAEITAQLLAMREPAAAAAPPRYARRAVIAAVTGVAAGLALLVFARPVEVLPPYTIGTPRDDTTLREIAVDLPGGDTHRASPLPESLVLRPAVPVAGPLTARAFISGPGPARAVPVDVTSDANGVVRVRGFVPALLALPAGKWKLVVLVGRPGELAAGEHPKGAARAELSVRVSR